MDNKGEFVITNNELIARGLKSPDSITRGRQEAWKLGFYDVVKTGTLMNYGIYRYSERWKNFPDGDYLPHDQPNPGKCLYPKEKRKLKPTTENVVSTTTKNVVKGADSVTTENVVIETGSPTTDSVVNIIMYQEDRTGVQVRVIDQRKKQGGESSQEILCSETSEDNQDLNREVYLTPNSNPADTTDTESNGSELSSIQHQWFIETFRSACLAKGVEVDLTLDQALASRLDDWLTKRLSQGRYLGNKFFKDENTNNIKEKLNQIVSQWQFIQISASFGEKIEVPPTPDLNFLITYREQIFSWVTEVRQRSVDAVLAQLDAMGQVAQAGYMH